MPAKKHPAQRSLTSQHTATRQHPLASPLHRSALLLLLRNCTIAAADAARQQQEQQKDGHPQQKLQQQNIHNPTAVQSSMFTTNTYIQLHTPNQQQHTVQRQQQLRCMMSSSQATQQLSHVLQRGSQAVLQLLQDTGSSQLVGQQLAAACMRGINIGQALQDNTCADGSNSTSGAANACANVTSCCSQNSRISEISSCSSSGCTHQNSAAAACWRALQGSLSSMSVASLQQLLQRGQALGLSNSYLDVQQLELQARLIQLLLPVQAALDGDAAAAAAQRNSGCGTDASDMGQQDCDGCCSQVALSRDTTTTTTATTTTSSSSSSSQFVAAGSLHSPHFDCQLLDPALLQAALAGVQGFVQQLAAARSCQQEQAQPLLVEQQRKDADLLRQQLTGLWEAIPRGAVASPPCLWAGEVAEGQLDNLLLAERTSSSSSSSSSETTRLGDLTDTALPGAGADGSDVPAVADWASSSHLLSLLSQHSFKHHTNQQQCFNISGLSELLAAAESALLSKLGALLRLSRGLTTAATAVANQQRCCMFYKQSQQQLRNMEQTRDGLQSRQAKGETLSPEEKQQLQHSEVFCVTASKVQGLQAAGMAAAAENGWKEKQQQWRAAVGELQEMLLLVGKLVTHVLSQLESQRSHQQCAKQQQQQQQRLNAPCEQQLQRRNGDLQQRWSTGALGHLDVAGHGIASRADTLWRAVLQFVDDADSAACRKITAALAAASSNAENSSSNCDGGCRNTCCYESNSSSMSCATGGSSTGSAIDATCTSSNSSTSKHDSMWQQCLTAYREQVAASTKLSSSILHTSIESIQLPLQAAASAGVLLLAGLGAFKGLGSAAVQLAESARQPAWLRGLSTSSSSSSSSRQDDLAAADKNGGCSSGACSTELVLPDDGCNQQQRQDLIRQHWLLDQGQKLLDKPRQQLGAVLLFAGGRYADDTTRQSSIPHPSGSSSFFSRHSTSGEETGTSSSSSSSGSRASQRLEVLAARYVSQKAARSATDRARVDMNGNSSSSSQMTTGWLTRTRHCKAQHVSRLSSSCSRHCGCCCLLCRRHCAVRCALCSCRLSAKHMRRLRPQC
jgi:hypothetical protein